MKILDLKLTYKCNNNCAMCCQDRELRKKDLCLTKDAVKDILEREKYEGIDKLILTGGEPTLNPDLPSIVEIINDYKIKHIQLQTNARLLKDRDFLDSLLLMGINSFGVSLHGHVRDLHEEFSLTENSFDECINALELLTEYSVPVSINCVITKSNIGYLGDILEFVQNRKIASTLQFAYIHITGKAKDDLDRIVKISEAAAEVIKAVQDKANGSIKIFTEAIPFCLMQGYEKLVSELYNTASIISYDAVQRRDFTKARKNEFKSKTNTCVKCLFNSICEGTWSEYPRLFGFDEFVPVKELKEGYGYRSMRQ